MLLGLNWKCNTLEVGSVLYLGNILNREEGSEEDIKIKIHKAREAFDSLKEHLNVGTDKRESQK
jgi:hypothetical protein